jgi:hypothetical protein
MGCTRIVQSDDGDAGPKTSQSLTEFGSGNTHVLKVVTRVA